MTGSSIEWCAGFFEGEGNFRINKAKGGKTYPCIQLAQVYREPLDAFQKCFQAGKVHGPYGPYGTNKQPYYQFVVYGDEAVKIANLMLPYLFQKKKQIEEALRDYHS
jgi:hypothetical protein